MKRFVKWLLGILAALVLLMVIAAVALPLLFDAEDLKRTIEKRGSAATGRELRIAGELDFTVFPWLAVEVGQFSLGNAAGFGDTPFASAEQARIGVGLLPLLRKELVADEIRIEGLQLDLQVDERGENNWADLAGGRDTPEADDQGAFANPAVAGLDLRDAQISYRDAQAGRHWVASALNLKTGALAGGDAVDFSLQGRFEDRVAKSAYVLDTAAEVTMDLDKLQFGFRDLELAATLEPDGTVVRLVSPTASADLENMQAVLEQLELHAELDGGATRADIQSPRLAAELADSALVLEQPVATVELDDGDTRADVRAGRMEVSLETQRLVAEALKLEAWLEDGATFANIEATRLQADMEQQTFDAEDMTVEATLENGATRANFKSRKASGGMEPQRFTAEAIHIDAEADGGKTRASIDSARLEADADQQRFSFTQPKATLTLDGQPGPIPVEAARADIDLAAQTLTLERFSARYAGADMSGTLSAREIQGDVPKAKGHLAIPSFVPRELMTALGMTPPETADPGVLTRGSLETDFDGSLEQIALTNLKLGLDDSRINGRFSMPDVEQGSMRFDLDIDAIDLDRYLPPESVPTGTGGNGGAPAPLPRDELRGWDAEGQLRVGRLGLMGMDLRSATLGVSARDNVVRLHPLEAGVFGGRYSGDITLDATGDALDVRAEHSIESFGLQALGERFAGASQLSGTLGGKAVTNGRGVTTQALLQGLNGSLDLDMANGVLDGINVWQEIYKAYAKLKGRPGPPAAPKQTEISSLSFVGPIRNGVLEAQELAGDVQVLRLSGKGAIGLADQRLDLGLTAQVRNVPEVTEDPTVASLAGKRLPLRISGPLAAPSVSVDFAELIKSEATDRLLEKLGGSSQRDPEEPVSEKDQMRDAAKGILRDLLNKDRDPPKKDDGGGG